MQADGQDAFIFEGSWREFARIVIVNILLTIVTLGIYRFWATARERRYLWSRTHFIDDGLEWTGTGLELFVGFLLVLLLFGIPFLFLQFGAQALILQGHAGAAAILSILAFLLIFYLSGVARLRALRYRLSRTYWHGIRGGSNERGWNYGLFYMLVTIAGMIPLYLAVPWSMMTLWNRRWSTMSFGPWGFAANGRAGPIFLRFLLFYLAPILIGLAIFATFATQGMRFGNVILYSNFPPLLRIIALLVIVIGVYILLGLIALAYYAAFLREAISNMHWGEVELSFKASTDDWLYLFLTDVVLVVCTLGIGWFFLSYRHWKFFITHLGATGTIDLNDLTQSTTAAPTQGEGLLDAFDVGAI